MQVICILMLDWLDHRIKRIVDQHIFLIAVDFLLLGVAEVVIKDPDISVASSVNSVMTRDSIS